MAVTTVPKDRTTPADPANPAVGDQSSPSIQKHPEYIAKRPNYIKIQDGLQGEDRIKFKGVVYLSKTSAQKDDDPRGLAYDAYKQRAIYFNYPKDTVDAAVGMLHREPGTVDPMPTEMDGLRVSATVDNEPLAEVLADINEAQVAFGGMGLLVEVPAKEAGEVEGTPVPYLAKYDRIEIVNWLEQKGEDGRKFLRMVTLSESKWVIEPGGGHEWLEQYRMCALDSEGIYWTAILTPEQVEDIDVETFDPPDGFGTEEDDTLNPYPRFRNNTLDYIPFVNVNVTDLRPSPQVSPILNITTDSIHLYAKEADLQQALFMQGQATPWGTGIAEEETPSVLGATGFMKAGNPEAQFGFMEVTGAGLGEMRQDVADLKATIISNGVSLVDTSQAESGKALAIRSGSKTSFLKTVAQTGAQGLRLALAYSASWMTGQKPSEITEEELKVTPNLDFVDDDTSKVADDALKLIQAKAMGFPISLESLHAFAQKKELTTQSFEDELAQMIGENTVT